MWNLWRDFWLVRSFWLQPLKWNSAEHEFYLLRVLFVKVLFFKGQLLMVFCYLINLLIEFKCIWINDLIWGPRRSCDFFLRFSFIYCENSPSIVTAVVLCIVLCIVLGAIFQLYNLSKDKPYPVTGLECEKMPPHNNQEYRYCVIATLPG